MVDVVNNFIATSDAAERVDLMKQYQKLYTENVNAIGLTQYPGALIINKRFANIPPGAPIFMFNWAEDNIIRERVYRARGQAAELRAASQDPPGRAGRRQRTCVASRHPTQRRHGGPGPRASPKAPGLAMFRFVASRILAAIPVLLVLSIVTFAIIKAQPGDYGDYLKSMLMSQGNVPDADAQAQADAYRADPRAQRSAAAAVFQLGHRASSPASISDTRSTTTSRSAPWSPSACRARCCWR